MMTEEEKKEFEKEIRNKIYWEKIERSLKQLEEGKVIKKTWEELRAMENE